MSLFVLAAPVTFYFRSFLSHKFEADIYTHSQLPGIMPTVCIQDCTVCLPCFDSC